MVLYQFRFIRGDETISSASHRLQDDLDALDEAAKLTNEFDVQIWHGSRKIARVKKGNAPLNEHDRYSN